MNESEVKGKKMPTRSPEPEDNERKRSSRYPRHSLKRVEDLAKVIFELGARNCDLDRVAKQFGYSSGQNGAFNALRSSASSFGLIKYPSSGYVSLSEQWINAFNSEDTNEIEQARRIAVNQPTLYRQLLNDYAERQLPNPDKLTRDLHLNQKYGILKDAASVAAQTFLDSVNHAEMVDARGFLRVDNSEAHSTNMEQQKVTPSNEQRSKSHSIHQDASPELLNTPKFDPSIQDENLDRVEIRLLNGKKVYIFVPLPLPFGEKERLKKFIDLLLEEASPRSISVQSEQDSDDLN